MSSASPCFRHSGPGRQRFARAGSKAHAGASGAALQACPPRGNALPNPTLKRTPWARGFATVPGSRLA